MHVSLDEDKDEIRVEGKCTISCIIFRFVEMVHAINRRPMDGLHIYGEWISQLNMGLFSEELCKEGIGRQRGGR